MCLFYYCNFALGECKLYTGITNYIYNKYWGSTNYIYNRYWGVQIPGSTYYMLHRYQLKVRQVNHSWSHSRLQANIQRPRVRSLQERTFSSPCVTSYPAFLHRWYGHFHRSRLDTLASGLRQFAPIWHFLLQISTNSSVVRTRRPASTASFYSFCSYRLHWLPIRVRIDFKIATLTYGTLTSGQPAYIHELIPYHTFRLLRSIYQLLLTVPRANWPARFHPMLPETPFHYPLEMPSPFVHSNVAYF